ncbi:MAG: LuxR C-terminal-related transcriptional regulator [Nostocaceae cyanobacterium]|nr:LuxR C-terminal-related transcriptional regulator [Nostocaceae cyanobacterium]
MLHRLPKINNFASTQRRNFKLKKISSQPSQPLQSASQFDLLQVVIESFVDGILVVTTEGDLVHTNEFARHICNKLISNVESKNPLPKEIWRVCKSLIESRELFPGEKISIESEIETDRNMKLRIRARWLNLSANDSNLLLVIVEDCNQSSESMAITDAYKYGLTDRETEVWLLRRANFSYKEIAEQLYITINTVKKHLKNIYAKQQEMVWS